MEGDEVLHQGRWLTLKARNATNGEHQVRWEFVERTTQRAGAYSVSVLAITQQTDQVIVIANYRYPVNKFVLELPAGLIDGEEDAVTAAIREIKEETGYTVRPEDVIGHSPSLYAAPWVSTESTVNFTVRVDLSLPENENPQQVLDEVEQIKVILLPKSSLLSSLLLLADKEDYVIDSRLYILAQGLELSYALS
jgi:8-oxo-dGTP pyrophosphatase MutT (NUDIX family)